MKVMGAFISQVYRILAGSPRLTAGEIFEIYQEMYPETRRSRGEVAKRLTQLLERGLVTKGYSRTCEFSGCEASTWKILPIDFEILSNEPAEYTEESSTCCGGGCEQCDCDKDEVSEDDDFNEETIYDDIQNMSREEKARRVTELCGETCQAVDPVDAAFLRECRSAIDQIDTNPMVKLLLASIPGLKDKAEKLKNALRYF